MPEQEKRAAKSSFYEEFGIPGVIGCIDGTHINLLQPQDGSAFFNRKGNFSINAMIICDHNMVIRAIDACHPGSSHDCFIWSMSNARQFVMTKYRDVDHNSWLLGDAGYALEPFLLTPYRNPEPRSIQHAFNKTHSSARNIVERTIGYKPKKVVKIINVCVALHNICRHYNLEYDYDEPEENASEVDRFVPTDINLQSEAQRIRDEIANNII
ncbi:putative nuclease HARBI1 [Rhagoletis pomonella]|uniref:putative nuclease HARBI1 n=1 Tax=Rhagoletis pomonella TaxID=28610 RepID=UPI001780DBEC|nr:putative nuclease HARBI1 [Rhagoletis pomonella]